MTLADLYFISTQDKYTDYGIGLIEDARHYEIGQISEKTGLQKCLINGRIVWLMPQQKSDFSTEKIQNSTMKKLAKSAKRARATKPLKELSIKGTKAYLIAMSREWKENPVRCPFIGNQKIRFDDAGYKHFFETKGVPRKTDEVLARAVCLPYIRDILERSGKPAEHLKEDGKESYSIIGRAAINGEDKGIKIVISKRSSGNLYYFSVNRYEKI